MKNLLVIDDDTLIRNALSTYLSFSLRNCLVRTAANGRQAMDIIRSEPVDVILTDIEMPDMDGFEVAEFAKRHFPAIPLLVMTGRHSPETEERAKALGASHYLIKPFEMSTITDLISAHLGAGLFHS